MADNSSNDFGAFLTGFVVGGLIGAAVALLTAPQSGEETREQIVTRGIELRDRAEDEVQRFRARAEETLTDIRQQAEDLQAQAAAQIEEARQRISGAGGARDGNGQAEGETASS
ncbi:MAG: YtxH domain-containing protein [Chloroflexi bacterium]|nr:YtxH domain-containing protein [Chloroflexota bacterium]